MNEGIHSEEFTFATSSCVLLCKLYGSIHMVTLSRKLELDVCFLATVNPIEFLTFQSGLFAKM